jgi:MFS family permease
VIIKAAIEALARLDRIAYLGCEGMGSPVERRKADDSYRVMLSGGSSSDPGLFHQEAKSRTGPPRDGVGAMNMLGTGAHLGSTQGRSLAIRFVVLIGIVSLFGDMTYEGARSVVGPYLATLGASATIVGVVAGTGELFGYVLRLISGYLGDRTARYWTVTIVGYLINLLAVPLLAVTSSWQAAAALIITERIGRGLRTPTRDAMLSHAATQTGAGWAFGLHEALDTTGAILGPLAIAAALYLGQSYKLSFAMLAIPALLSILSLLIARAQFPEPRDLEIAEPIERPRALPRAFWIYAVAAALIAAGYADFSLLAYHFGKQAILTPPWIPVFYAGAMAAAAATALGLGHRFDRAGAVVIIPATVISAFSAPLAFLGGPAAAALGVVCWGVGMGTQESVMRAIIGTMAPPDRRATAFGLFHAIFGVAWFAGSSVLGYVYDHSVVGAAVLSLVLQLASLPVLIAVVRRPGKRRVA